MNPSEQIAAKAISLIGLDFTWDNIPNSVACADAVSTLLHRYIDYRVPVLAGTASLDAWLAASKLFVKVDKVEPGCIVSYPTGSNGTLRARYPHGHVLIALDYGRLASNNSFGRPAGLWTQNYTVIQAHQFFHLTRGFKENIYKKIA